MKKKYTEEELKGAIKRMAEKYETYFTEAGYCFSYIKTDDFQKAVTELMHEQGYLNTIEVGKVYGDGESVQMIMCVSLENDEWIGYGIDHEGNWFNEGKCVYGSNWREIPKVEWLEALKKEAIRRGYRERNSICISKGVQEYSVKNTFEGFRFNDNGLWIINQNGNENCIMKNGKWADFIESEEPTKASKFDELECINMDYFNKQRTFYQIDIVAKTLNKLIKALKE